MPEPMEVIRSASNTRVKRLRALADRRGIRRHGAALVCGRRLVADVLRDHAERVECRVRSEAHEQPEEPLEGISDLILANDLFREIDVLGTGSPILVVGVEEPPPWDPAGEPPASTLFLPLGDPENLGAALRSAEAFEIERVVLLTEAAHPFHPRAVRASAGACFSLQLAAGPALREVFATPPPGLELLVLDRPGEPLDRVATALGEARFGLVVGEEGSGMPIGGSVRRVEIPFSGSVESLNASVAVGIALWELSRASKQS